MNCRSLKQRAVPELAPGLMSLDAEQCCVSQHSQTANGLKLMSEVLKHQAFTASASSAFLS